MKATFALVALVLLPNVAIAQYYDQRRSNHFGYGYGYGYGSNPQSHYVRPRFQSDGSFIGGHYRTNPNNTTLDNFGTRGNFNPYTGQTGRRNPYAW